MDILTQQHEQDDEPAAAATTAAARERHSGTGPGGGKRARQPQRESQAHGQFLPAGRQWVWRVWQEGGGPAAAAAAAAAGEVVISLGRSFLLASTCAISYRASRTDPPLFPFAIKGGLEGRGRGVEKKKRIKEIKM